MIDIIAAWAAPVATIIAALMTAVNGGARLTGWGFVVFSIGAVAWLTYGVASNQPNLIWQNGILLAIDIIGVWRWLGQQARYQSGASGVEQRSAQTSQETLFAASSLAGTPVNGMGEVVDAMIGAGSGRIVYVVSSKGGVAGVGEDLMAVPWSELSYDGKAIAVTNPKSARHVEEGRWPSQAF